MAMRPSTTGHAERDASARVSAAIQTIDGLSLVVPVREQALRWTGADAALAITLHDDGVEVRLAAHRLPLPPLLHQAAEAIRAALHGTGWEPAPLRLVIAELTAQALVKH